MTTWVPLEYDRAMSEDGWRAFLAAEGGGDWVVLHGGPTAVYRVGSVVDAAKLAVAVGALPGFDGSTASMTITTGILTVRLTREMWFLDEPHIELARAVSALAREHGAVPDRSAVQEIQLAISAKPDAINLAFWRAVLGYRPSDEDNGMDPLGFSSTVWMQPLSSDKSLQHAMHVDVSLPREQAEARLEAALAAGGRIVDDSAAPEHWVLSDPAGNRVCICAWPDGRTVNPTN